jgi:hypothetical protein
LSRDQSLRLFPEIEFRWVLVSVVRAVVGGHQIDLADFYVPICYIRFDGCIISASRERVADY